MFEEKELKPLKGSSVPNNLIVFDTETNYDPDAKTTKHTLKMAYIFKGYYTRKHRRVRGKYSFSTNADELCGMIESYCYDGKTTYIYAHNIFFDLQVIGFFEYFTKKGWKLSFSYDAGLTFLLKAKLDKKSFCCVSTTNYFSFGLAKLGDLLKLPKLKVDLNNDDFKSVKIYCKRDVEILVHSLENYFNFLVENDCGKVALTRASQAMTTYRYKYMDHKIMVHHHEPTQELENHAYYGGRTECFYIGEIKKEKLSCYDINSMYPYVMVENQFPTRLLDHFDCPTEKQYRHHIENFLCTAEVIIDTEKPYYPVRYDKKLVFPVGRFKTYLSTPELKHALKHNHIKGVNYISLYEGAKIFERYIKYFYDLKAKYKKQGNEIYTNIVKIFLNALYGKFGQKIMKQETVDDFGGEVFYRHENFDVVTGETFLEYKILNKIVRELEVEVDEKSFIGIASHVTSYARMYLNRIIDNVGFDRVLYCDTDSVYIRHADHKRLGVEIDKYALGALDLEMQAKNMTIYGLKDYVFGDKVKLKGIPKKHRKIDENTYEYDSFLGFKEHMRRKETEGFITRNVVKHLSRDYTKGVIMEDGRVKPFTFDFVDGENTRIDG